jgi:hypothetical protein
VQEGVLGRVWRSGEAILWTVEWPTVCVHPVFLILHLHDTLLHTLTVMALGLASRVAWTGYRLAHELRVCVCEIEGQGFHLYYRLAELHISSDSTPIIGSNMT